jgi:hypothetical protein
MAYEYYFNVNTDDDKGTPFGPVNKDNMDISRLIVDFTTWLDPSQSITRLDHMMIKADPPQIAPPWQANYPLDETSSTVVPVDTYPLEYVDHSIIHSGKAVVVDLSAGTPGLTYAVSFSATAGVSLRRRLVDILMVIDIPLNPDMVALSDGATPSYTYPLVINTTTLLPVGFTGKVYVENTVAMPITVTLPPTPDLGDAIDIKDVPGNAATYNITVVSADGSLIDDMASYLIEYGFGNLGVEWSGSRWSIL